MASSVSETEPIWFSLIRMALPAPSWMPLARRSEMCIRDSFKAGKLPLTVQSMDNCSHNGDKVKNAVHTYAAKWVEQGLVPAEFLAYVQDETKITFPWSMIDKITPRPDAKVQKMLADDGFEDNYTIVTEKHTFTAPFVNAEETQYLCIEDHYTNGRPPLELGGVLYCGRETVDKIEKMKVCTCLNPLHTAMSIYGCMLGYTLISAEMADEDLRAFIQKIGYIEAMPVVVDPGVLNPYEFIGAVINRRLPNPFMPDAPQRKMCIRDSAPQTCASASSATLAYRIVFAALKSLR